MAAKTPKKVTALTAKLLKEYNTAAQDSTLMLAFLQEHNIDANALKYKPDIYSTYNHYIFMDCFDEPNLSLEVLQFFIDNGADLNLTGYNGGTVLHIFTLRKHIDRLEFALKNGALANAKDNNGNTPINELIRSYGDGKMDIYWDGKIDKSKPKDFEGRLQFIELLLKYGADPTLKNNYGDCALDWVQERKNEGFDDADNQKLEHLISRFVKL